MRLFFNRCGSYRKNVCLLASGVLPSAECSAVENHLGACAACQKYYGEIKSTVMPFADWEKSFLAVEPDQEVKGRWDKEFQASVEAVPLRLVGGVHSIFDWCYDLIWPCRRIWAGFAAVWLAIFAIHFSLRDTALSSRPPAEMVKAFLESEGMRTEFSADKLGENREMQPAKQSSPPSHSERHSKNLNG